jgi:hypothetical protein
VSAGRFFNTGAFLRVDAKMAAAFFTAAALADAVITLGDLDFGFITFTGAIGGRRAEPIIFNVAFNFLAEAIPVKY